jgi:predicted dehydrogenase
MSRLRFGVVGCGAIVTLHQLPALLRSRALKVVAMVDRDKDWAAAVARKGGVQASYDDHLALVGKVDAALVATPNSTHVGIVCDLLEQGVHVICEKPLGTTRFEVDRMLAAAAHGRARLMTAHCLRFAPSLAMMKDVVASGWLGDLREVSASIGGPYAGVARRTDFRRQRTLSGGGVLMDLGIHVLDLTVWLAGSAPTWVDYRGTTQEPGWEVETDVEVGLGFADGARASLVASFTTAMGNGLTVRGSRGWARTSLYETNLLTLCAEGSQVCRRAGLQSLPLEAHDMYDTQIAHFCDALRTGEPFRVADSEVRATIDVVGQCYASNEQVAA